jgi:WD40 repeat protein
VWDVAFDAAGERLASVSDDRTLKLWRCEYKDGEPLFKLAATLSGMHRRSVFGVSWSAAGALATACGTPESCAPTTPHTPLMFVNVPCSTGQCNKCDQQPQSCVCPDRSPACCR